MKPERLGQKKKVSSACFASVMLKNPMREWAVLQNCLCIIKEGIQILISLFVNVLLAVAVNRLCCFILIANASLSQARSCQTEVS